MEVSKRTETKKEEMFWPTPDWCVDMLVQHLKQTGRPVNGKRYIEPCAGDGRLIERLTKHGMNCLSACDIKPRNDFVKKQNAASYRNWRKGQTFITNPPWQREHLHPIIDNLLDFGNLWLLIDSDWVNTLHARNYPELSEVIALGRVSWMGNKKNGFDNACWYHFIKDSPPGISLTLKTPRKEIEGV